MERICYQYDSEGYLLFATTDYGQGLPNNCTYIEPLEAPEGYSSKFNSEASKWELIELPLVEVSSEGLPERSDLVRVLNRGYKEALDRLARQELILKSKGLPLDTLYKQIGETMAEYSRKYAEIEAAD